MKKFLTKFFLLFLIPVLILSIIIILLPPGQLFKKSFFYSLVDKNKLLKETKSPRIIFIGGSDLSYGLNSKIIKDSLNINPINTAITGALGLKYILANTKNYIKENDIIVLSVDYSQFYDDVADGNIELLSIIVDVAPESIKLLDFNQFVTLSKFLPEFMSSKCRRFILGNPYLSNNVIGCYERLSFNSFGDAHIHWTSPKPKFQICEVNSVHFNEGVFQQLINFRDEVERKRANLFITFQCLQDSYFEKAKSRIFDLEKKLKNNDFLLISNSEKYKMPDSLLFDGPSHLNKKGVDIRTKLLIEDLKKAILAKPTLSDYLNK